jgi:hypothetical protein
LNNLDRARGHAIEAKNAIEGIEGGIGSVTKMLLVTAMVFQNRIA